MSSMKQRIEQHKLRLFSILEDPIQQNLELFAQFQEHKHTLDELGEKIIEHYNFDQFFYKNYQ